ncbi:MAG: hypothetical protein D3903_14575, partial [Candidatus Electrothrix sp. GM3_4]|nr:hypothetical protein [Candidatus Electrothrix sp. GM3_4]
MAAAELEQEARVLVSHTQDILLSQKNYLFVDIQDLIEQSDARIAGIISRFGAGKHAGIQLPMLVTQYRRVADNQRDLVALKKEKLRIKRQQDRTYKQLAVLLKEVTEDNLLLFPQLRVPHTNVTDMSLTNANTKALQEWYSTIFRAIALLISSYTSRYQQHIETYAWQMEQNLNRATKILDQLPAETKGKL